MWGAAPARIQEPIRNWVWFCKSSIEKARKLKTFSINVPSHETRFALTVRLWSREEKTPENHKWTPEEVHILANWESRNCWHNPLQFIGWKPLEWFVKCFPKDFTWVEPPPLLTLLSSLLPFPFYPSPGGDTREWGKVWSKELWERECSMEPRECSRSCLKVGLADSWQSPLWFFS